MKNKIKSNKGASMAEVLVGFMLLVIIMTSFYGLFKLSTNMIMSSADQIEAKKEFEAEYYKTDAALKAIEGNNKAIKAEKISEHLFLTETNEKGIETGEEIAISGSLYKITDMDGSYGIPIYILAD